MSLLEDMGVSARVETISEPSSAAHGRLRWLSLYIRLLASRRKHAQSDDVVLVTWPVLGYWDFALMRAFAGSPTPYLIVHDPRPLSRAAGYGGLATWTAGRGVVAAKAIVHSQEATRAVGCEAASVPTVQLPLPMFTPREAPEHGNADTVVRVLGQYKAARDVAALEEIAVCGDPAWRYEIVGRGWPAVNGWAVTSAFVSEGEFERLIVTSSAVVIPYRRFFQSDVALRCLEMGTPVVGPRDSSLAELLGPENACLVRAGGWAAAIEAAVSSSASETFQTAQRLYGETYRRWGSWLAEVERDMAHRNGSTQPVTALRRLGRA
jgi:hypothetical protein